MFHGTNQELTVINSRGVFGGIFAASSRTAAESHGNFLYEVASPKHLSDFDLNYAIDGAYDVALDVADGDETVADAIMDASCGDASDDAEYGLELQRLRGVLAARLGFTSVEMKDEHGTVTLCLPGCSLTRL